MKKRTWPYGTRKTVTVLHWIGGGTICAMVVQPDDEALGKVLTIYGTPRDFPRRVRPGDGGSIVFTHAGWRYEPLEAGAATVNAAVAEAAGAVAHGAY
jgi:hypothetical protein